MASKPHPFTFQIPQLKTDLNNDRPYLVGYLEVNAIASLFPDGTFKCIDINNVYYFHGNDVSGTDITAYVMECQPETWGDIIMSAAKNNYLNTYVTSKKSPVNL